LIADSVREVIEIDEGQIDPPPKMGCISNVRLLDGITKHEGRFVLILNADKIFSENERIALHGESQAPPAENALIAETADAA
jgi:purine-binding chemotaxis protein CheW